MLPSSPPSRPLRFAPSSPSSTASPSRRAAPSTPSSSPIAARWGNCAPSLPTPPRAPQTISPAASSPSFTAIQSPRLRSPEEPADGDRGQAVLIGNQAIRLPRNRLHPGVQYLRTHRRRMARPHQPPLRLCRLAIPPRGPQRPRGRKRSPRHQGRRRPPRPRGSPPLPKGFPALLRRSTTSPSTSASTWVTRKKPASTASASFSKNTGSCPPAIPRLVSSSSAFRLAPAVFNRRRKCN